MGGAMLKAVALYDALHHHEALYHKVNNIILHRKDTHCAATLGLGNTIMDYPLIP